MVPVISIEICHAEERGEEKAVSSTIAHKVSKIPCKNRR